MAMLVMQQPHKAMQITMIETKESQTITKVTAVRNNVNNCDEDNDYEDDNEGHIYTLIRLPNCLDKITSWRKHTYQNDAALLIVTVLLHMFFIILKILTLDELFE